jgi:hypothetical protein
MNIILEYPWYFTAFCFLLAAGYSLLLYRRNKLLSDVPLWLKRFMAAFRFTAVFILSFLLLSPLLRNISRQVEKPVIIVAQDNSESLVAGKDSSFYRNEYREKLRSLIASLGDKYEIRSYSFADKIRELSIDSMRFNEKQTDISSLFDEIETRYSNRNVGAVILATDGLYNKGSNPLYAGKEIRVPIYTIALGDTTVRKDLVLAKVEHNRLAYLGNDFPLQVVVTARELKGKTSVLTISKGGSVLFTQNVNINSDVFTMSIPVLLQAKEVGLQRYRISLSPLPEEASKANNSRDIFIDVLDSRQKVLILAAAPHPDVAAIKQSIEGNQNYEVESYTIEQFNKSLKLYNLVILHQVPASANKLVSEIKSAGIPVWAFSGANAILRSDLSLSGTSQKVNECEPVLEPAFPLFTISEELRKAVRDFPALSCPFGTYQAENSSNVLFYQRIGVVDTKTPLMLFNSNTETKTAIFTGEGIWKWRLQDYAANSNTALFDEFISKTVQYLSVRVDKSNFKVITKNNFMENDPIEMEAELYNESYELVNEPEVSIVISNEEYKKYPFVFSKTSNAYRLNAGNLPVGEYRYEAKVKAGTKIYTQKGEFSVSALQVELTNTVADHQMLYTLSKKHNAEMVFPAGMEKLAETLKAREDIKTVSYSEKKLNDLINLKWIFFVLLALLSAEWFMRKRNGAY